MVLMHQYKQTGDLSNFLTIFIYMLLKKEGDGEMRKITKQNEISNW